MAVTICQGGFRYLWRLLAVLWGFDFFKEPEIANLAEEVAGVEMALAPGFLGRLGKLPVMEAGTEATGNRLGMFRALVMTKVVIGKASDSLN